MNHGELQSRNWTLEIDRNIDPAFFIECNSDSLDISIFYNGLDTKHKMDFLFDSLSTCENIVSLDLAIAQGGCAVNDYNPRAFLFENNHRFASDLQELKISGYDWDHQSKSWLGRTTPINVESWKSAMDWSKLKVLSVDLPPQSFLESFKGHLKALESFSLRPKFGYWGDDQTLCRFDEKSNQTRANYTSFVAALRPLRSLSIGGLGYLIDLEPILKTHGDSLRNLILHENERSCIQLEDNNTWSRPTLSDRQLQNLNSATPHLETLEIDIARNADGWPQSTFEVLSNFSQLRNLTLHFVLEDLNRTHPVRRCALNPSAPECFVPELMNPVLSVDVLQRVFRGLRQSQDENKGLDGRLQWLHAYTGDYGRQLGGGYRFFAHDEHNHPQRFACGIVGEDEAICEIFEMQENPADDPWDVEVKVGSTAEDL